MFLVRFETQPRCISLKRSTTEMDGTFSQEMHTKVRELIDLKTVFGGY